MKKIILFFVMTLSWGLSAQVKPMTINSLHFEFILPAHVAPVEK